MSNIILLFKILIKLLNRSLILETIDDLVPICSFTSVSRIHNTTFKADSSYLVQNNGYYYIMAQVNDPPSPGYDLTIDINNSCPIAQLFTPGTRWDKLTTFLYIKSGCSIYVHFGNTSVECYYAVYSIT